MFVFPNNKNIQMAAEQCAPLTEKNVVVIPTRTVPQGISAMLMLDESAEVGDIREAMLEAIEGVHTALVTYAARDSEYDGFEIHAGEYLALMDGSLMGSYNTREGLFDALCESAEGYSPTVISVYYGEDVSEGEAEVLGTRFSESFPDAEISVVCGGQPVYYYMVSIE